MNALRPKKIYLLRHGVVQGFSRKTYIGRVDIPLNSQGIDQAKAWQRFFLGNLPPKIFCSDLKRCVAFAKIIAGTFSDRIYIEKALREITLGRWEGVAMEDIRLKEPEQWARRGGNLKGFRPPGGESFADLAKRVIPVFQQICENAVSDMIIVGHAGVNRVILADIMDIGLNDVLKIPQDYAAGYVIEITRGERKILYANKLPHMFDRRGAILS
jgi:probable phosphoglycerate mutase